MLNEVRSAGIDTEIVQSYTSSCRVAMCIYTAGIDREIVQGYSSSCRVAMHALYIHVHAWHSES